ncbi:hypothetical protein G6011_00022 [Alternaria panax]|jgi:hypothetical protein|uniref:Uncharacterized protein n=1 Tax=Alternaria panax TaxID=48097 RepID=A0AAD4F8J1_9PLEO|nr:hypothetical protein G6011_00022 [Alternaria panax]
MSRFMIAFSPPEYSQQLSDRWENYFRESILPKMKGCKWSQEKSGWGYLEYKDASRVFEVMNAYGWKMGVNSWGSLRFDPMRQGPPEQEPTECDYGASLGAVLDSGKKNGKRRSNEH